MLGSARLGYFRDPALKPGASGFLVLSNQGEKSKNLYFIMVPLRKKVLKYGTPMPSLWLGVYGIRLTKARKFLGECRSPKPYTPEPARRRVRNPNH